MKAQIPWLRVFVEGAVIVGSILLAFVIDAWWDGVQERELEREYLGRLVQDLDTDLRIGTFTLAYLKGTKETLEIVRLVIEDGEGVDDPRSFLGTLYRSTRIIPPRLALPTYSELLTTGNLRLIRNVELLTRLAEFFAIAERRDRLSAEIPPGYRDAVRRSMPTDVMAQLQADCDVVGSLLTADVSEVVVPCAAAVSEAQARALVAAVVANESVVGELRLWWFSLLFMEELLEPQLENSRQLREAFSEYNNALGQS